MADAMTEREVFDSRMGRTLTDDEIYERTPKRDKKTALSQFDNDRIYKPCDVCATPICVNNWPDEKSRTPKMFDFVLCTQCDPRHIDDRYMKAGYRIANKARLRVVNMARITRAVAKMGCLRPIVGTAQEMADARPCKCAGCAALKLFPGLPK